MSNKPVVLTLSYFGKTITIRDNSSVLHPGEVMDMFKSIMIPTFGQEIWNNLIESERSYVEPPISITQDVTQENDFDPEDVRRIADMFRNLQY
jgi:hypothetical protein